MTAQVLTLTIAACLVALGLVTAIARRHRLAPVIGAQLGGLGGVLSILTLVGVAGEWFAALVVVLAALMGLLVAALLNAGGDESLVDEEGDPLKW
jgi:hypothetical protein